MPLINKKTKFNIFAGSGVGLPKLSPISPRSKFTGGNQTIAPQSTLESKRTTTTQPTNITEPKIETPIGNQAATTPRDKFVNNVTQPITGDVQTPSGATVSSETGALVTAPPTPTVDPKTQRFEDSREAFVRSLTPSPEEIAAQVNLNKLVTQAQTASDVAGRSGETIGFARGRQAQVNLANQRQIDAAERRLGAITGQREIASEGARTLLELEEGQLPEDQALKTQVIQAGGKSLLIDTQTGETIQDLGASEGALSRAATAQLAAKKAAAEGEDDSGFLKELGGVATGVITDISARISPQTVGFGALLSIKVPGTPAFDFSADLETLKADIGFGILQSMRDASKTGGALGQVSERELAFLQNTLGSLNQLQSSTNFRKNLNKIQESIDRWTDAVEESGGTVGGGSFTTSGGNEVTITEN